MKHVMLEKEPENPEEPYQLWFGIKCSCGEYFNSKLRCLLHEFRHKLGDILHGSGDGDS